MTPSERERREIVPAVHHELHGRIQTIRGMCTDEEPYERIDVALAALDEIVYALAGRLDPSFSGEEGTGG